MKTNDNGVAMTRQKRDWRWHLVTGRITHRLGIGGAVKENAKLCSNSPTNKLQKM